jgi:hypothetical protein
MVRGFQQIRERIENSLIIIDYCDEVAGRAVRHGRPCLESTARSGEFRFPWRVNAILATSHPTARTGEFIQAPEFLITRILPERYAVVSNRKM